MSNKLQRFREYFPDLRYDPLKTDSEITKENINIRLRQLFNNQSANNRTLANVLADNPRALDHFFERYGTVRFRERFKINNKDHYLFDELFHNDSTAIDNIPPGVNYVFDLSKYHEVTEYTDAVLVFDNDGLLIPKADYKVLSFIGGSKVFVREVSTITGKTLINDDSEINIVALRKVLYQRLSYSKHVASGDSSFSIPNFSINVAKVLSGNDIIIFYKQPSDTQYRALETGYTADYNDVNDVVKVTLESQHPSGTTYLIMSSLEYFGFSYTVGFSECETIGSGLDFESVDETLVLNNSDSNIPMTYNNGIEDLPLPLKHPRDILVFLDGYKLIPDQHYTLGYGSHGLELVLDSSVRATGNMVLRVVKNGYMTEELRETNNTALSLFGSVYTSLPTISDAVIDLGSTIISHFIKSSSLIFTNGRYYSEDDIRVITDSVIYMGNLKTSKNIEILAQFITDDLTVEFIKEYINTVPELKHYIELYTNVEPIVDDYLSRNSLSKVIPSSDWDVIFEDTHQFTSTSLTAWLDTVATTGTHAYIPNSVEIKGDLSNNQLHMDFEDNSFNTHPDYIANDVILDANESRGDSCPSLVIDSR